MTIQILEIVLYSHDNRLRTLPFHPGRFNVITGASKTGKSALISIVDYCFGSSECNVPEGPIRRKVAWFGLRLKLKSGEAFIARRCPPANAVSSEDCFVAVSQTVEIPPLSALRQQTNTKGLEAYLTGWCGIRDNIHEPPPGQTRPPLGANFRHALAFCFQPQDEIIRRQYLFHGSTNNFLAQAIRDTLPYFLGAVDDDYVQKRDQLKRLREELRICQRQLTELKAIRGDGVSKAASLLAQTRDAQLSTVIAESWDEAITALRDVAATPLVEVSESAAVNQSEYKRLSNERRVLLQNQQRLREEIDAVKAFEESERAFLSEAKEQQARLASIGLFGDDTHDSSCPLCSQTLPETEIPSDQQLKADLAAMTNRLETVTRAEPQIEKARSGLNDNLLKIQLALAKNRSEMEAVRSADDQLASFQDVVTKQAHILGRVSLYLESVPELPDTVGLEAKEKSLQKQCFQLEEELSSEVIQERIDSIISRLGRQMSEWAQKLGLEHSDSPMRLDLKRLTVVADTDDGPIPMERMGSGENWVGFHLIAHLALHRWFAKKKRPVPGFLFLDQPSQVYFPSEKDVDGSLDLIDENDRAAVNRMFLFIANVVKEVRPDLQVIMTEHADLDATWYQKAIIERWRGGKKLIPDDWPRRQDQTQAQPQKDAEA